MPLRDFIVKKIQENKGPTLKLENAGICDEDVSEIITLVNANPRITIFYLTCNNISNNGAKELASLLHVNTLKVSQNNFGDEGALALLNVPHFSSLDLSRNRAITDKTGCVILGKAHHITLKIEGTSISNQLSEKISARIEDNLKKYYDEKNRKNIKDEIKSCENTEEKTISSSSPASFFPKMNEQDKNTKTLSSDNKGNHFSSPRISSKSG